MAGQRTNLTDGGNIFGSTTTNLTINNVSVANVGTYSVIVSNIAGVAISSNASLTITPSPPVIILQPVNQTAVIDQTAAFTVAVIGSTPFFYQWSFDGTNIVGATNTTLTLTNVQFNQAGNYAVLVTNAYGSTLSSNAVLTVIPCSPAPSGLVDWWPGEGNAYDVIGTNNGTLVGDVSYVAGEVGQAFSFNGSNSYVSIQDSPSLDAFTSRITIELWMKSGDLTANSDWKGLVTKGNSSWRLMGTSGAKTVYLGLDGVSNGYMGGTRNVKDGQWHHVAGVYDGTNMFLYVDGTLDASQPATGLISQNTYPVCLGELTEGPSGLQPYLFNGLIDEVSIYNRALTASEIQAIYAAGSGGKCPPPPTPPAIAVQPTNQTVYVGGTASFSVTASGTLPLSYQWNFNGTNLSGATNTVLTLTNTQLSQAGNYAVLVTNLYGSILSSNAVLTVNPPPPCASVSSGLVDWWPGEGNAYDIAGANNGTLGGGASYAAGEVGQAFSFDGTSGYVSIPDSPSLDSFTNRMTVELWMKTGQTNANSDWKGIVTKGNSSWRLQALSGAKTVNFCANGVTTSNGSLSGSRNVNDGQWHHVAAVYDGTNMFLYVDGTLDVSQPATGTIAQNSTPVWIGANATGAYGYPMYFFNGLIDETSLYNRALTASEIQTIYAAGSGGKCPPSPTAPSITTQPVSQTNIVGTTANFSITASGTAPLSYQWNFNGMNLSGATNTSLTLTNVQFNQAGNYAVLVTNLYGSILSSNALLTVNPPPPCDPAPSGLVDWWPGEGNANDVIGTNNGTLVGGVSYAAGEVGQAFSFNGTNSYVSIPDSASLDSFTSSITIELWMKAGQTNVNSDWKGLVTKGNSSWWLQAVQGTNTVYVGFAGLSPKIDIYGTRNVNDGQWHHVAAVYDGTNMFLYVDGTVDVSQPATGLIAQDIDPVCIGANAKAYVPSCGCNEPGYFFNGLIDEASLYNRALTALEIQAIYAAGSGGKCPPAPTPPAITMQPASQTNFVGTTATFSVTASGTAPLSYQWNFGGTNIVGATNTSLTLTNVQFNQAGNYGVLVTNLYSSILSSNAVLTVNSPPPCDPVPSGLVSWWPVEGNANDVIGTNNGVAYNITYTNGEVGQAFVFDGLTSYIQIPASSSLNVGLGNGFTFETWVNPAAPKYLNNVFEWNQGSGSGTGPVGAHMQFGTNTVNALYANIVDTSGGQHPISSAPNVITYSNFQHVALTYNEATGLGALFVNGVMVTNVNLGIFTPQTSYNLYLGVRPAGVASGNYLQGELDEASLYNRALTATEIQAIYVAGSGRQMSAGTHTACHYNAASEPDELCRHDGDVQRDGQRHSAVELPVELQRNEHCGRDQHQLDADQRAVESGGQLCGAGDQPLWFHPQFQCGADGACIATNHYHPADESNGDGGWHGEFQCYGQRHVALELPMEVRRNEHCGRDQHRFDAYQCAIESGGQLCGAGDQSLWFGPQFQCVVDSESAAGSDSLQSTAGQLGNERFGGHKFNME